jgi:uncharacterized protein YjbJ (UPF0337 family)
MNRQQAQGHLRQVVGVLRKGWGKVIDDRTMQVRGERDKMLGRAQAGNAASRKAKPRR